MGLFSHKDKRPSSVPAPSAAKADGCMGPKNPANPSIDENNGKNSDRSPDENTSKLTGQSIGAVAKPGETLGDPPEPSGPEEPDVEADGEKKQYAKEKAPVARTDESVEPESESETETLLNTKLNAMLYHTSEDSIDMYRNEIHSLDLLGRLYYDDYDPENLQVVERVTSFTSLQALARGRASPAIGGAQGPEQGYLKVPSAAAKRPLFERQVSFDTLSDTRHLAITLKVKHPEFKFRRNNKTFLIGFSNDSELMKAVEWAFLEMVISGDTIIVFQVLDEKCHTFVDPSLAEIVLEKLKKLNTHSKRISLVFEVVIGHPQKLLKKAILEYKPAMMIVGTHQYGVTPLEPGSRSLSPAGSHPQPLRPNTPHTGHPTPLHRSLFSKSSTSKYFLQFALVPVILVKPFYTIHETLDKPVDSENYFRDWLANIDVAHTREKKKKHMFGMRSRLLSRNLSQTSLTDYMRHDPSHERIHDKLSERLQERAHEMRGRSLGDMFLFQGPGSRDSSRSRSRSRTAAPYEAAGGVDLSAVLSAGSRPGSRSESRSRSRSRLSRLFSG